MRKTTLTATALILGCTILTGCGMGANSATPTLAAKTNPSTSVSKNHDDNTKTTGQSTTGATQTSSSTPANSSAPEGTETNDTTQLISQSMQLATAGKVMDIPYVNGTATIDEVSQAWGQPSSQNEAGAGMYATFPSHDAAFGFNKGSQIFDIRSSSPKLQQITLSQVKQVLGEPGETRSTATQTILMYPAGPKFQLLWIFPKPSATTADPKLDHISVFYPEATVNSMAQTQVAPSVVVDQEIQSGLFTFGIQNPPKGYRLVEFEWIGSNGQSVVNTYEQAVRSGQTGKPIPGFEVSGDGQTLSFLYPSAMKGQSGIVKLIYQNTDGAAMIGQSNTITLK
ncbi:YjgB family protein [Alicyclobacillus fodiniaquatilis]|uniref:DUF4309 domain-containing protein n=1 Tax=Alicyclobacillus fodiniaquatilis TaxID=1661150 RepID=A0ABW4JL06_9BACL